MPALLVWGRRLGRLALDRSRSPSIALDRFDLGLLFDPTSARRVVAWGTIGVGYSLSLALRCFTNALSACHAIVAARPAAPVYADPGLWQPGDGSPAVSCMSWVFLGFACVFALLTGNAFYPRKRGGWAMLLSFVAGCLTTELALHRSP
jgi:hypothetical protein